MQHIQFDDEFDESAINDKLGEFAENERKGFCKKYIKTTKLFLSMNFKI